jgi:hypothetical protein
MMKSTHQILSVGYVLLFSVILRFSMGILVVTTILSVWFGILNDIIDFKLLGGIHRNWFTHSPISPLILIVFLIILLVGNMIIPDSSLALAILLTSTMEIHLLLDAFNPTGISIIPSKNVSIKNIPYDDYWLNVSFSLIGIVLFIIGFLFII